MRGTGGDHLEGIKSDSPPVRRHRLADRRGQSLVEFALVLPILLLIVVGILEFGLAFRTYQVVTNAAREGARTAVLGETSANVETVVNRYLGSAGLNSDLKGFTFECVPSLGSAPNPAPGGGPPCSTGQTARVVVSYPINFVIFRLVNPDRPLTSVSEMRTE